MVDTEVPPPGAASAAVEAEPEIVHLENGAVLVERRGNFAGPPPPPDHQPVAMLSTSAASSGDPAYMTALAIETATFISDSLRAQGMSMADVHMRAAALSQSLEVPAATVDAGGASAHEKQPGNSSTEEIEVEPEAAQARQLTGASSRLHHAAAAYAQAILARGSASDGDMETSALDSDREAAAHVQLETLQEDAQAPMRTVIESLAQLARLAVVADGPTTTWSRLQVVVEARLQEAQQFLPLDTIVQLVHSRLRALLPLGQIPVAALQLHRLLGSQGEATAGLGSTVEPLNSTGGSGSLPTGNQPGRSTASDWRSVRTALRTVA